MTLGATLACVHAATPIQNADAAVASVDPKSQGPGNPAEERREMIVQIKNDALVAPDSISEGTRTVEFSNDTKVSWTCGVSSGSSTWKVENPVPPGYAGAVNVHFNAGDYVFSCTEGSRTLKKKIRVTKN